MSLRDALLDLIRHSQAIEQAFLTGLPETERRAEGSPTEWSAKDTVAHLADWRLRSASHLVSVAQGETPPDITDFDSVNEAAFQRHHAKSWDDVLRLSAEGSSALAGALQQLSDEKLAAPSELASMRGRPWWRYAVVEAAIHPLEHLAGYAAAHGRQGEAIRWQEENAVALEAVDADPAWRGTVRYNLACHYARAGNSQKAIRTLGTALQWNPDLVDWSRQDSDLDSLREDPAYQALYASR
ncbi:MAG TPA: DinB family protein [Anaerolineales bacterium]|nr:DinB family protein [Anaerolineales bacterium]